MNIRSGFVSNSSSSSFIVVGKRDDCVVGIDKIYERLEKNPDEKPLFISSVELYDGQNVFTIRGKIKEWFMKYRDSVEQREFWNAIAVFNPLYYEESYGNFITPDIDIPLKDLGVIEVNQDHHSFDSDTTEEDFKRVYNVWN